MNSDPSNGGHEYADLVVRYRAGDGDAARELFDQYVARLIGLVRVRISSNLQRRFDAEDIVQSTFRSFFSGVMHDRYQFADSGDLWRLLTVMALNKLRHKVEYHSAAKRGLAMERESPAGSVDQDVGGRGDDRLHLLTSRPLPEAAVIMMEEFEFLTQGLDEHQIEMIRLRMDGYQLEEIAAHVGRSERTVRRVLEQMRTRWEERCAQLA